MGKQILSVGFELAHDEVESCPFDSNRSLLDWDIVLFRPNLDAFYTGASTFQGKSRLGEWGSLKLKEATEHWRREIKDAMESGKSIFCFLPPLVQVYVDTGRRETTGTGRNQSQTTIVAMTDNYRCLPMTISVVAATGSAMKVHSKYVDLLHPYWSEFEKDSKYQVVLTGDNVPVSIETKVGGKAVGAAYRSQAGGVLFLLPDVDFTPDDFYTEKADETYWSKKATQFANRFVSAIVAVDKAARVGGESSPEPAWLSDPTLQSDTERRLGAELLQVEGRLEELQREKETLLDALRDSRALKALLFEKGPILERAIVGALKALGFKAENFKEGESEFDVVFESNEGRLIGEAEGKDAKPINVDKLRQLSMNVQEDFQRQGVTEMAKGVLFGNAYRLHPLGDRRAAFTDKCISGARTMSAALISTVDLFRVVQALEASPDEVTAAACRRAIVDGIGLVQFPIQQHAEEGCQPIHEGSQVAHE